MAIDEFADDINDLTLPFGAIVVGGGVIAALQDAGDQDWFRVQLTAGVTYTFNLMGESTSSGTLSDPLMRIVNSGNTQVAINDDNGEVIDTGGLLNIVNHDSRIFYTPATSGTYYIVAASYLNNYAGSYVLTMDASGVPGLFTAGNDSVSLPYSNGVWHALAGDDVVFGTSGSDTIYGDAGADYLSGGLGDDRLDGRDSFRDRLVGGDGADLIAGDSSDYVFGGGGADSIAIFGSSGLTNGYVFGGDGGDTVELYHSGAGSSFVTVEGESGNDTLRVADQNQNVTVELYGEDGADQLFGGKGADWLSGGNDADMLYGGAGGDRLLGGAGNDWLDGQQGSDILYGGAGSDRFAFTQSQFSGDVDTIKDFEDGIDLIVLPSALQGHVTISQSAYGYYLSADNGWGLVIEVPWSTNITVGGDVIFA